MSAPDLSLAQLAEGTDNKESKVNDNGRVFEVFLGSPVIVKSENSGDAPASPSERDVHIVAGSPSGGDPFEGEVGNLAAYVNGGWIFQAPWDGMLVTRLDDARNVYQYNGSAFILLAASSGGGKQMVPILAQSLTPNSTNGPAEGTAETTTNAVMLSTLDFDDTTDESAQILLPMPKSWNEGTISARFRWTSAAASGNVVWGVQAVALSDDDPVDAAFGAAQTVTDSVTAADDLMTSAETSAVTIGGTPAEGDLVAFKFFRDADNGSDTMTGDAKLLAVDLFITTDAPTDA